MSNKPSYISRLMSKFREIPLILVDRFLLLFDKLDFFLYGVSVRFKQSFLSRLWLKVRWVLLGLFWLTALGLGYAGLAKTSKEQALGWSISELILRTLKLFVMDSGVISSGIFSDQVVIMLEISRVFLIFSLFFTGFLVFPRLVDKYL